MQLKQKFKRTNIIPILFCLGAAVIFLISFTNGNIHAAVDEQKIDEVKENNQLEKQVIVTYFHTNYRCASCKKIEKYSKELVENKFKKELKEKKVVYRTLNMIEPENKHYIDKYKLVTKSIVLSLMDNDKEVKWKNLPDIWKTIRNKKKFDEYLLKEIHEYMKVISSEGK